MLHSPEQLRHEFTKQIAEQKSTLKDSSLRHNEHVQKVHELHDKGNVGAALEYAQKRLNPTVDKAKKEGI